MSEYLSELVGLARHLPDTPDTEEQLEEGLPGGLPDLTSHPLTALEDVLTPSIHLHLLQCSVCVSEC